MPLVLDGTNGVSGVDGTASNPAIEGTDSNTGIFYPAADTVAIGTGGTERVRVDSAGNAGLGVTPSAWALSGLSAIQIKNAGFAGYLNNSYVQANAYFDGSGTARYIANGFATQYVQTSGQHIFYTAASGTAGNTLSSNTQAMTLDASGRLLIGNTTSRVASAIGQAQLQIESASFSTFSMFGNANNADGSYISLNKARGGTVGGTTAVQSGDVFGGIFFEGYNGTGFATGAYIYSKVDGTVSGSQMPGRLEFYTTPTGSNSPVERARITSGGDFVFGKTSASIGTTGSYITGFGEAVFTANANPALYVNRLTDDGDLVRFFQATTQEGTISVSGTTVSYNGGHLARYSQLLSGQRDESIVKGTVLSNLDEMCEWLDAEGNPLPNEQLNRMKVSDVEGDTNVAGVFVNWDNDDQDNPYDMNIAMTGDMIIRIAQGVTVQKGDLLMSAGDGTAKPQGDDIVRSKTIAKVTSNHVTCTYDDGSYCVPCVLMAC